MAQHRGGGFATCFRWTTGGALARYFGVPAIAAAIARKSLFEQVTFAPAARNSERLSAMRCIEAYRLRWQVELQFKRWKSICNFDRLPNYRDDAMLSWLTAKVLLGMLLDRVASASGEAETNRSAARQPWKLTTILWPLVVSALMPVSFASAVDQLPALAQHLDSLDDLVVPRQIAAFREAEHLRESVISN